MTFDVFKVFFASPYLINKRSAVLGGNREKMCDVIGFVGNKLVDIYEYALYFENKLYVALKKIFVTHLDLD
jgi:hypothetical protein